MPDSPIQVQFTLTRMPKTRMFAGVVAEETLKGFEDVLWPGVLADLELPVASWSHHPTFQHTVDISEKIATFTVMVKMDQAGQIYEWVNKGTGLEGKNHAAYPIDPKTPGVTHLKFYTPYIPLTIPPGGLRYPTTGKREFNVMRHVDHPGIQARKFTEMAYEKFKSRTYPKGFRSVIEAAYKRAFRWLERNSDEYTASSGGYTSGGGGFVAKVR